MSSLFPRVRSRHNFSSKISMCMASTLAMIILFHVTNAICHNKIFRTSHNRFHGVKYYFKGLFYLMELKALEYSQIHGYFILFDWKKLHLLPFSIYLDIFQINTVQHFFLICLIAFTVKCSLYRSSVPYSYRYHRSFIISLISTEYLLQAQIFFATLVASATSIRLCDCRSSPFKFSFLFNLITLSSIYLYISQSVCWLVTHSVIFCFHRVFYFLNPKKYTQC